MLRHILPNAVSPIIVTGSLTIATSILIESALSFMGLPGIADAREASFAGEAPRNVSLAVSSDKPNLSVLACQLMR